MRVTRLMYYLSFLFLSLKAQAHADYYSTLSGGYSVYKHVFSNDGASGLFRFSLGAQTSSRNDLNFGVEVGIQTGNRMRIDSGNAISAIGTAPVFLTIKPMYDILATLRYDLSHRSIFLEMKGGASYSNGLVDSLTIPNKGELSPEIQAGFGIHLSAKVTILFYYQHIFNGEAQLINVNSSTGTARLSHLPTLQSGFVGLQMHF